MTERRTTQQVSSRSEGALRLSESALELALEMDGVVVHGRDVGQEKELAALAGGWHVAQVPVLLRACDDVHRDGKGVACGAQSELIAPRGRLAHLGHVVDEVGRLRLEEDLSGARGISEGGWDGIAAARARTS